MRPYVLIGTAILMSVSTSTLPHAGTVAPFEAYKSYPAANADERVGGIAEEDSSFTWSGGGGGSVDIEGSVCEGNADIELAGLPAM